MNLIVKQRTPITINHSERTIVLKSLGDVLLHDAVLLERAQVQNELMCALAVAALEQHRVAAGLGREVMKTKMEIMSQMK